MIRTLHHRGLRKMGAQLHEEEHEKGGKTAESPFIAAKTLLKTPVSAAVGMSTDSGDKLNLRTSVARHTVAA